MGNNDKASLKEQGSYILHLREEQQLSLEAFAERLDVQPSLLGAIERGERRAPDKIIRQLPDISNAYEHDMNRVFGERWSKLKGKGYKAI